MQIKLSRLQILGSVVAVCAMACGAQAQDYVVGMNFVVSHNTTISQLGVFDGGVPLTSDQTVGIFDDSTGTLVGSELVFGPGYTGTQDGNTLFENLGPFTISAGEYSIVSIGSNPGNGTSGSYGGNPAANLGNALDLPGGNRFDSGTVNEFASSIPSTSSSTPLDAVDPVPDGASTAVLLGGVMAGLGWLRRKI